MADRPWLSIIGVGEDGPNGLCTASRLALSQAEIIMGPPRHLSLVTDNGAERIPWPVPFADGIARLETMKGRAVAVLTSGDPFWFGAGAVLARQLEPGEWRAYPGRSTFSLAAARMGWAIETTACLGLHAAPLTRLRPHLATGRRLIVLLRDGSALASLAQYLTAEGFGASAVTAMESLAGPSERLTEARADGLPDRDFAHPICAAIQIAGDGAALPLASGRADDWFDHDGQITKRPVRALTLSALAPRPYQRLWDIGGGSGSIAIEWLLSDPSLQATAIEARPDRAGRITANAARLGVDRLRVVTGRAPDALTDLPPPEAVFVGGGMTTELLDWLTTNLPAGTRLVANAVTLETEALLTGAHTSLGGDLMRIELSQAAPIGPRNGWKAAWPIVQWSLTL